MTGTCTVRLSYQFLEISQRGKFAKKNDMQIKLKLNLRIQAEIYLSRPTTFRPSWHRSVSTMWYIACAMTRYLSWFNVLPANLMPSNTCILAKRFKAKSLSTYSQCWSLPCSAALRKTSSIPPSLEQPKTSSAIIPANMTAACRVSAHSTPFIPPWIGVQDICTVQ